MGNLLTHGQTSGLTDRNNPKAVRRDTKARHSDRHRPHHPAGNAPTAHARHRVILTLLYDSECRVQELCDMAIRDIQTGDNPTVRLHGKGNKYRTVAIARNTAKLVSEYIKRQRRTVSSDQPLIVNQRQAKLSRDGVNYIIRKYVHEIQRKDQSFPEIHAHGFRHSKAMHMLEDGINIVYIRDFLGHEDVSTTTVYIRADNRLKTEAVNKLAPKVTGETEFPDWTKDTDLMSFLNSFK